MNVEFELKKRELTRFGFYMSDIKRILNRDLYMFNNWKIVDFDHSLNGNPHTMHGLY